MTTKNRTYGITDTYATQNGGHASIIGAVENTISGNAVLRVGRTIDSDGHWTQTEHVVLTPNEALALADELRKIADLTQAADLGDDDRGDELDNGDVIDVRGRKLATPDADDDAAV